MREDLGDLVYPVLAYLIRKRDALDRGDPLELDAVQADLRALLKSPAEAQRLPDFGGDGGDGGDFLGVRYALTCWLDERFIDSPWKSAWRDRKLEEALYGTNDRAWKFWHQAGLGQRRQGGDALEAYNLCVLLGFRGDGPEKPQTLQSWRDAIQGQLARDQTEAWPSPPEQPMNLNLTPLQGRERLRRAVMALLPTLGLLIVLAASVLVKQLSN
jgi:type VI secretion system protein ImpK